MKLKNYCPHRIQNVYLSFFTSYFFVLFLICGFFLSTSHPIRAASSQQGSVTVSATVPANADTTSPSVPVLVSPSNNSYSTTAQPTFVWEKSTDNVGIDHYDFIWDGSTKFAGLATTSQETSEYSYVYDSFNEEYRLTPKNNFNDATHTWKIRAVDTSDNGVNSATWNVTIDTQSPSFVISQIGDASVSISAQDSGTWPTSPIELSNNEPLIVSTGEASSGVDLTVTIPSDPTQNYSQDIDVNGDWSYQLGIFERGKTITLDFIITDQAGNTSVITDLEFIVKQEVIVIGPPSPSATPSASPVATLASPSPQPSESPAPIANTEPTPSPEPEETPAISIPLPIETPIKIPFTPPREAIINFTQEIAESIPKSITDVVATIPEPVKKAVQNTAKAVAPVSAAVVASSVPVATSVAVASQFGSWQAAPQVFIKSLQSLGLVPKGKPQGMVFNSRTYEPVPFALLTIQSTDPQKEPIIETVVTDVRGIYGGIKLAANSYIILASHQDFNFPTAFNRPSHLSFKDFYKGEEFAVTSKKEPQLFLIPMDPKGEIQEKSWRNRFRVFSSRLSRLSANVQIPLFFITGLLTIVYPTLWNQSILGLYGIIMGQRLIGWFKTPLIVGEVVDENQQPLANTIIRLIDPQSNELVAVSNSNDRGQFEFFVSKGNYQIDANKSGYLWYEDTSEVMSSHMVDATTQKMEVLIAMKNAQSVYQDLFA